MCSGWRAVRLASAAGERPRCAGPGGSWPATSEEALARIGDVSHQIRRCLQIPIGVGYLGVPKVRGQGQHVPGDSITAIRAGLQCPHGKRVAKGVNSWSGKPHSTRQTDLLDDIVERGFCVMKKEGAPAQRDEHMVVQ